MRSNSSESTQHSIREKIYRINSSSNCRYIFTSGEDNLLKVWDYHLRGGLTPNF